MFIRRMLFTGFFSGYCPIAPGTAGTMMAIFIFAIEYIFFYEYSWIINLIVVVLLLIPAIKIADEGRKYFKCEDPPQVVIDEMLGFWIAVLFFPFSIKLVIIAFVLFRLFDIIKPYPISRLDKIRGGLGIMLDDYLAGVAVWLIIFILIIVQIKTGQEFLYNNSAIKKFVFYGLFN